MFPTVAQSVPARLISDAPRARAMQVSLTYNADDPLAVRMVFPPTVSLNGTGVTWTFARSLLDSGLHTPSGAGDVHIWPCGRTQTMVELRSPDGVALLQFDTARLRRFLLHTYATVPKELETRAIDMEHGLATLLREAQG
ncbi:SsgA family sporulation/cell division regulator [Streptomyces sp. NPDC020681]|uniref:SsgA family sporulation/cell division regulator n=1 Tax=Streptomyces sp. NPDC020681 TaxID=3365083 RepID=UPI00379876DB